MSKNARYIQHCRVPKYLPGHQALRGGASLQKLQNMEGLTGKEIEALAILGNVYAEFPAPEASIKQYLNDPIVGRLLERLVDLSEDVAWMDGRLNSAYSFAVSETVKHEGCESGKREFLEGLGVPEEMWPTQTFTVTFTREYDVICLDQTSTPDDMIEEAISEDETPLAEMDYSIKKDSY